MTEERRHEFTRGRYGWITHTDIASTDPAATTTGARPCSDGRSRSRSGQLPVSTTSSPTPTSVAAGCQPAPGEGPGSTPTVHVEDTQASFDAAVAAGAVPVRPPTKVMDGVCVALVRAPGDVLIGFSGPTD